MTINPLTNKQTSKLEFDQGTFHKSFGMIPSLFLIGSFLIFRWQGRRRSGGGAALAGWVTGERRGLGSGKLAQAIY